MLLAELGAAALGAADVEGPLPSNEMIAQLPEGGGRGRVGVANAALVCVCVAQVSVPCGAATLGRQRIWFCAVVVYQGRAPHDRAQAAPCEGWCLEKRWPQVGWPGRCVPEASRALWLRLQV